ncbi:CHC2 zinc finger domain-containing protein, partial [Simplicispira metamorpha]
DRRNLPEPVGYYEAAGLVFRERKGKWRTTRCEFHGGSDSMRINTDSGAFACMACGASGGDVLAYEMQATGAEFIDAAKALGCWVDDGQPAVQHKPTPLSPRAALQAIAFEVTLVAIEASRIASGIVPSEADKARVLAASNRITRIMEVFA